ncbi:dihydrofolate reductase family protein [Chitinimonas sp. BJYL2]|uniref:dihydrofolate reductase family protein n=1 Tax=Chitinimonas sp. BJYL2 TaxID=2976696 RepID=UPI0022B4B06B|nr:dihydrofolate reductase family protein [Chitinimonas sp. BJYL2]
MRKLVLFIASSLDGYIARPDGGVDWLFTDQDYGYQVFYDSVDAILLGRRTYDQTLTFGEYPYPDKHAYVFTSRPLTLDAPGVEAVAEPVAGFISQLKHGEGGKLWLVGGAALIKTCLEHDLIDEFIVSIHPLILGSGIPLFPNTDSSRRLSLVETVSYETGLVQVRYERARKSPMHAVPS